MLKIAYEKFCNLLYPPKCQICFKQTSTQWPKGLLCLPCQENIIFNRPPFCLKCSRWIGTNLNYSLCAFCRQHNFQFDFAWSACLYETPLKELIHQYKFEEKTYLRHLFSNLITEFINQYQFDIKQFDVIVPIPLSSTRFRERGFNQSLLLAKLIAKEYNIALLSDGLIKTRHTPNQSQLSQKERFTNLKTAFRIKPQSKLQNKNVLLIDDLLTTGSTASEAALVLKKHQAKVVGVLTLATTA